MTEVAEFIDWPVDYVQLTLFSSAPNDLAIGRIFSEVFEVEPTGMQENVVPGIGRIGQAAASRENVNFTVAYQPGRYDLWIHAQPGSKLGDFKEYLDVLRAGVARLAQVVTAISRVAINCKFSKQFDLRSDSAKWLTKVVPGKLAVSDEPDFFLQTNSVLRTETGPINRIIKWVLEFNQMLQAPTFGAQGFPAPVRSTWDAVVYFDFNTSVELPMFISEDALAAIDILKREVILCREDNLRLKK